MTLHQYELLMGTLISCAAIHPGSGVLSYQARGSSGPEAGQHIAGQQLAGSHQAL